MIFYPSFSCLLSTDFTILPCLFSCTDFNILQCLFSCTDFTILQCFFSCTDFTILHCLNSCTDFTILQCLFSCTDFTILQCLFLCTDYSKSCVLSLIVLFNVYFDPLYYIYKIRVCYTLQMQRYCRNYNTCLN